MSDTPRTIVMYHGSCPDGFGGAYAAWKKFGDTAEYIPLHRHVPPLEDLHNAHLYFIDFTYTQDIMDTFVAQAASVTVLDHHEGVEDVVRTMPEYRYAEDKSGATIAWEYFHPGVATPKLLQFVEDDDIFRFALPETRAVLCYITARPYSFELWDSFAQQFDSPTESEKILEKANTYAEYFEILADMAVEKAELVHFEGHDVYFANAHPLKPLKSLVGNKLAQKTGTFALVVSAHPKGYGVSIRGVGDIDVAAIAFKYGGNGHTHAAGFAISADGPLPWVHLEKTDEDSGN